MELLLFIVGVVLWYQWKKFNLQENVEKLREILIISLDIREKVMKGFINVDKLKKNKLENIIYVMGMHEVIKDFDKAICPDIITKEVTDNLKDFKKKHWIII